MTMPETIGLSIARARSLLDSGELSSEELVNACLVRIDDPRGEGAAAFIEHYRETAIAAARTADGERGSGAEARPLSGIPISIKDLFDMRGSVTRAGSAVLRDAPPAAKDCDVVQRLRAAGAIIIGRTNLSEFAFTGLGLNPHYGSPRSPYRRDRGYVAGGSSSGSAVSVSDGMALASIGSDTGGSGRIPAAFCGIVGFKPTRGTIPLQGVFPLARSFDTVSPMANTVDDCRLLYRLLSGDKCKASKIDLRGLRLGVVESDHLPSLDQTVEGAFKETLAKLGTMAKKLDPVEGIDWSLPSKILQSGRITAVEGLSAHGLLFERKSEYDPRVASRFLHASGYPATSYAKALHDMHDLRITAGPIIAQFDALILPTSAILPPALDELEDDERFVEKNMAVLRNTLIANVLDCCAISLPIPSQGGHPVAITLMGRAGDDERLLSIAGDIEAHVCPGRSR